MQAAYAHAIATGYRFYSYGDVQPALEGRLMARFPFEITGHATARRAPAS